MSFERSEPARAEELQSIEAKPTDGKKVGWDKSLDAINSTWDGKDPEKEIPTIKEMALKQEKWGAKLNQFAQENPDVLSTKDQWPEAVKQAWFEVKEKWPL